MKKYQPQEFEKKWRDEWKKEKINSFQFSVISSKKQKKFYNLVELPYTSGDLHIGHWFTFTIPDVLARFKKMNGYDVFFPIGYDAFGLPAENAAIKRGIHPKDWTMKNVENMTKQFHTMGTMLNNWDDVVIACLPEYYRWNQWIFLKMYERGLAYRGRALSNWCPSCQTVLANENIENGKCWRCGSQVVQKEVEQWFLRITDYADRLLWPDDPDKSLGVNWPIAVRVGQNNWIGRKEGINITYKVISDKGGSPEILSQLNSLSFRTHDRLKSDKKEKLSTLPQDQLKHPVSKNVGSPSIEIIGEITCFTTTPVNFGATFLVIAPEHAFVNKILANKFIVSSQKLKEIQKYVEKTKHETEEQRKIAEKEKTGVFTGFYAINHVTGKPIPIWISDFVLMNVGTGAVQGCPGHDYRDFDFAKKFGLAIPRVVTGANGEKGPIEKREDVVEHGRVMVNSDFLNGVPFEKAMQMTMDYFEKKGWGKRVVTYHLRDWSVSRQRYWGTPVPIIYCRKCWEVKSEKLKVKSKEGIDFIKIEGREHAMNSVPEKDLPVELPYEVDFTPKGKPPLATNEKWLNVKCPKCGSKARRDAETLDTFFDSSWYWLRYVSPHYDKAPFATDAVAQLTPVDVYFGGAEHTLGHTLYARFFTKFFHDLGLVDYEEFALKRVQHGVVLGPDGARMSKSKGNVINPDDQVGEYGADTVRMYLCFMMPYEATGPWSDKTIAGVNRFLNRVWKIYQNYKKQTVDDRRLKIDKEDRRSKVEKNNLSSNFNPQDLPSTFDSPSSKGIENKELIAKLQKTIKKVTNDIEKIKMNTAIAAMMEFLNEWENVSARKWEARSEKKHIPPPTSKIQPHTSHFSPLSELHTKQFLQILAPFAPYMTEEIWRNVFGENESIHLSSWPKADEKELVEEEVKIPVQVNGKVRSVISVSVDPHSAEASRGGQLSEKTVVDKALKEERINKYISGKSYKVIYIKGKILNLVIN